MTMSPKKHKYLIPIPPDVAKALKHAAVARELTISGTIVLAVRELVERDGWLGRTAPSAPAEVSNA